MSDAPAEARPFVDAPFPLSGGTAVWIVMAVEVVTFGMFLLVHAWGWRVDPGVMEAGRRCLDPGSAARGTALLVVGSGFAWLAAESTRTGDGRRAAGLATAAAVAGSAFCVNKLHEYGEPALAEVTLSTSRFWFGYLFLTGLHLLHVVGGVGALGWVAARALRGHSGPAESPAVDAIAAYWHLVDVIWLLLFPILYLMHP